MQVMFRDTPIEVNKDIMQALSWNSPKTHLEFMLYVYFKANTEKKEVMGQEMYAADIDTESLMEYFGYGKSRIYGAIQNLVNFGVAAKMTVARRDGSDTIILLQEQINFEKVQEAFPRNVPAGDGTIPVERFQWNDSSEETVAHPLETKEVTALHSADGAFIPATIYEVNSNNECTRNNEYTRKKNTRSSSNKYTRNLTCSFIREGKPPETYRNPEACSRHAIEDCVACDEQIKVPDAQEDLFGKQPKKPAKSFSAGYHASEYVKGGSRYGQKPRNDKAAFVRMYMYRVYNIHRIDYHIPKNRITKYYQGATRVLERLGGLSEAERYLEWFMRKESFKSSGFSLDLIISAPVINQYLAVSPSDARASAPAIIVTDENREEILNKARIV